MARIGFHASHEQFPPSELLRLAAQAEASGFDAAMCSDHLFPWSERQGHSGFSWSWLGAAMQATSTTYGVVTAPVQRQHPVLVAQAIATLGEMFPGRFWAALGSGQQLNEHITGDAWPIKPVRNQRLREAALMIRALLDGETVDHDGLVAATRARVFSRPTERPALFLAALSPETARFHADWADGLITVNQPAEKARAILDAFRTGGGEGKPAYVQIHLSWAGTDEAALAAAHDQWSVNALPAPLTEELSMPDQFDAVAKFVRPEDLHSSVLISSDLGWQAVQIRELLDLGFDGAYLHNVGRNQEEFVETFAAKVLPELRDR